MWEIEANALSLQGEDRDLYQILRVFHGFNPQQCSRLRLEGYSSLSDLVNWKFSDIRSLLENLSNRAANRGGQQFGDRRIKQQQALAWFLTDRALRGLDFNMNSWIENFEAIFVNQQYRVADKICLDSAVRYMSSHYFSEYWSLK